MENGMDSSHRFRKAEGKGSRADLSDDGIWHKVLFGEFLGWPHRAEVLGFNKNLISDAEVRRGRASSICGTLIMFLSQRHFNVEELVKLIKVYCVLSSAGILGW